MLTPPPPPLFHSLCCFPPKFPIRPALSIHLRVFPCFCLPSDTHRPSHRDPHAKVISKSSRVRSQTGEADRGVRVFLGLISTLQRHIHRRTKAFESQHNGWDCMLSANQQYTLTKEASRSHKVCQRARRTLKAPNTKWPYLAAELRGAFVSLVQIRRPSVGKS